LPRLLTKLFERHRIVFWYDAKKELRSDFDAIALPETEKLELINNEYAVKYRILRENPTQKFLLYREGHSLPMWTIGFSTCNWPTLNSALTKRLSGYLS